MAQEINLYSTVAITMGKFILHSLLRLMEDLCDHLSDNEDRDDSYYINMLNMYYSQLCPS